MVQLDNTVERDAKILVSDVLRAHERPEQGDRVEDDARDAEVDVLVRPRRETAVGAGAHDTLLTRASTRRSLRSWKKRFMPCRLFYASAAPVLGDRAIEKGR